MAETADEKRKRVRKIVLKLAATYGDAECALHHDGPFQLLCATILSAQCTDERVNLVTPELFRCFPGPRELALADRTEVERIIQSTGFFRAKAKNLQQMAAAIMERFGGQIPKNLEDLTQLAGVGRKTANVLLGTAFGIPSGVVVDTHVTRITNLLGLVDSGNAVVIERELMALLPPSEWIQFSHRLIHHGRKICVARRPRCRECPLLKLCPRTGLSPLPST